MRTIVPRLLLLCAFTGTDSMPSPPFGPLVLRVPAVRSKGSPANALAFNMPTPDDDNMFTGQGDENFQPPQQPPQQGLSVIGVLSTLVKTAQAHPRETGYAIAAGTAAYGVYNLRRKYRAGWPFPLQQTAPHFTLLRPKPKYLKQEYFPGVLKADFNGKEALTRDLDAPPPGFRVIHERIKIGVGKEDYEVAVRAMRAWRMVDSVEWLSTHSSKDASSKDSESLAIVARTAAGYVVGPWRVSYAQEGPMPEKQGRSVGLRSVVGISSLAGNNFEGEVRFSVEWLQEEDDRDSEGAVWFDVFSVVRRARGASLLTAPYYFNLHKKGLGEMTEGMEQLMQTEKEMMNLRRTRQTETDEKSRGEKAEIAARALQRQKDKEELKAKEWHRNNSGYGGGHAGFRPETMSRMRKMQHD